MGEDRLIPDELLRLGMLKHLHFRVTRQQGKGLVVQPGMPGDFRLRLLVPPPFQDAIAQQQRVVQPVLDGRADVGLRHGDEVDVVGSLLRALLVVRADRHIFRDLIGSENGPTERRQHLLDLRPDQPLDHGRTVGDRGRVIHLAAVVFGRPDAVLGHGIRMGFGLADHLRDGGNSVHQTTILLISGVQFIKLPPWLTLRTT